MDIGEEIVSLCKEGRGCGNLTQFVICGTADKIVGRRIRRDEVAHPHR